MALVWGETISRRVVVPRQIAMYLLHEETDLSLARIGVYFGRRDHTTVLHSCQKIRRDPAGRASARHRPGREGVPGPRVTRS